MPKYWSDSLPESLDRFTNIRFAANAAVNEKGGGPKAAHSPIQLGRDARRGRSASFRSSNYAVDAEPKFRMGFRNPAPYPAPVVFTMISRINSVNSAAKVRTHKEKGRPESRPLVIEYAPLQLQRLDDPQQQAGNPEPD
jgi:hypothetical protein